MPPKKYKRKYNKARAGLVRKYGKTMANVNASVLQAAVRRTLFKNAESKTSQFNGTDAQQVSHNSFINIAPNNVLATSQGLGDPENSLVQNRIGDKITLLKAQFRMMIEINPRFSDVSYRILLVKSSRGDTPTSSTLFNGLSGNKMLDTINYERFSVIYQKWGKIKAGPESSGRAYILDDSVLNPYTGITEAGNDKFHQSAATKIIKFDVPGSKFAKDGIIQYGGDNLAVQKFFDYNLLIYAYSNYATSSAEGYYCLTVNDYFHRLVYKDF